MMADSSADAKGEASEQTAVQEFLVILEEHQKNCVRQGKYIEADIARKRLEQLSQHEGRRRQEELRARQVAQRVGVEEAHGLEFQQFNAVWDAKMREYEERAGELLEAMRLRHVLDQQVPASSRAHDRSLATCEAQRDAGPPPRPRPRRSSRSA